MARTTPIALRASAGPRVRATRSRALDSSVPAASPALSEFPVRREYDGEIDAATLLRVRLETEWRGLLPWALPTPDPARRVGLIAATGLALALGTIVLGLPSAAALAPPLLAALTVLHLLNGEDRRAHRISVAIDEAIAAGARLEDLESYIEELLRIHPEHDGARLLLAVLRLQRGESLAALVQLAPLRDRHPETGEIVLLAALAYASLDLHEDALRMLDALAVDADHPWGEWVRRLHLSCRRRGAAGSRATSGANEAFEPWSDEMD